MSEEKFKVVTLPQDAEEFQTLRNQGYYVTKEYKDGDNIIVEMRSHSVQLVKLQKAIKASPKLQEEVKKWLKLFQPKKIVEVREAPEPEESEPPTPQ